LLVRVVDAQAWERVVEWESAPLVVELVFLGDVVEEFLF
jgi:hypothetical protein